MEPLTFVHDEKTLRIVKKSGGCEVSITLGDVVFRRWVPPHGLDNMHWGVEYDNRPDCGNASLTVPDSIAGTCSVRMSSGGFNIVFPLGDMEVEACRRYSLGAPYGDEREDPDRLAPVTLKEARKHCDIYVICRCARQISAAVYQPGICPHTELARKIQGLVIDLTVTRW